MFWYKREVPVLIMSVLPPKLATIAKCVAEHNLHPKLKPQWDTLPDAVEQLPHLIVYGPPGAGKYSQLLAAIQKYSPSRLEYERKLCIGFEKTNVSIKMSDIHFEIDIAMLGHNSRKMWGDIYQQMVDIVIAAKPRQHGIIVCKNFQTISNDLLDVFYTYMNDSLLDRVKMSFVLVSSDICFIPSNIIQCSRIISVPRPSSSKYSHILRKNIQHGVATSLTMGLNGSSSVRHKCICDQLIGIIGQSADNIDLLKLRDLIYDLFIFNVSIHESIWYMTHQIFEKKLVSPSREIELLTETLCFCRDYNNHYRAIYHIEKWMIFLYHTVSLSRSGQT